MYFSDLQNTVSFSRVQNQDTLDSVASSQQAPTQPTTAAVGNNNQEASTRPSDASVERSRKEHRGKHRKATKSKSRHVEKFRVVLLYVSFLFILKAN